MCQKLSVDDEQSKAQGEIFVDYFQMITPRRQLPISRSGLVLVRPLLFPLNGKSLANCGPPINLR